MSSLEEWIVGITEGEGSFCICTIRDNYQYPTFTLGNCDESVVKIVSEFFGFGHIYSYKPKKKGWSKSYLYSVVKRSDVEKIWLFFKDRLRTKNKRRDIEKWNRFFSKA